MLNMSKDNELEELDRLDVKYMFVTDTLGWAKGLENKEKQEPKAEDKPKFKDNSANDFGILAEA